MAVFGSLRDLFRRDDWSQKSIAWIGEMLDLGAAMFDFTSRMMFEGVEDGDAGECVYQRDRQINVLEREVRRSAITRLSMGSAGDVPSALIFTNAVKDGERIGDYVKNLYDVAVRLLPEDIDRDLYRRTLGETAAAITELFTLTRDAFVESDRDRAEHVIGRTRELQVRTEDEIAAITRGDMRTNDAVCLVLSLRFYKRILGHMSNMVSSVVMPVDLMDFFDEPSV